MRTEKRVVIVIEGRVLTNPCGTVSDVWKGGYRDILCTFRREGRKCDEDSGLPLTEIVNEEQV